MGRETCWLVLLLLTVLFYFCAVSATTRLAWIFLAIIFGIILIVEKLFAEPKAFMYEPNYANWAKKNEA
jgi:uncharacterized membrane protein YjdF